MPETPPHISRGIDELLDRLNATWDLQLPRLHGPDAQRAENSPCPSARKCSSLIQFFYYRSKDGIDSMIKEFEEDAKYVHSKWVYKPSQEKGTLPTMPVTKSFIQRDMISRKNLLITASLRDSLVGKLCRILEQEYMLAQDSDFYQRMSSQNRSASSSRTASFTTVVSELSAPPSPMRAYKKYTESSRSSSATNKRHTTSGETHEEGKRTKTRNNENTNIKNWLAGTSTSPAVKSEQQHVKANHPVSTSVPEPAFQDVISSFETVQASSISSDPRDRKSMPSLKTSFMSEENSNLQDDASTQCISTPEFNEAIAADPNLSFLLDSPQPKVAFSVGRLEILSPFLTTQSLPSELRFWLRWEIYRIAPSIDLMSSQLLEEVESDHRTSDSGYSYQFFWNTVIRLCNKGLKHVPTKSESALWETGRDIYESVDGKTASFSFKLEYEEKKSSNLWNLTLLPIKIDKGNRIHYKFGADRHVVGYLEYFDKGSLPTWIRDQRGFDAEAVFERICQWLAVTEHHVAGRSWRVFFLEQEQKSKQRRETEARGQKVHLFAVDKGFNGGLQNEEAHAFSIADLINWHMPFKHNKGSNNLKLFSRFGLALSKTRATIMLEPHQFRHLPNKDPVMNDGCALMSLSLAKAIWEIYGDGTNDIPSAFQGRVGGAKGLWILDYRGGHLHGGPDSHWIQVSDSQLKIKPHPMKRLDADEFQRTFEVLKHSTPCKPGHLNIQLINILYHGGVDRSTLCKMVRKDIERYIEASRAAGEDAKRLRAWLQEFHNADRSNRPVSFEDGLPEDRAEEMCLLVESGFDANDCEHLRDGIKHLMKQYLDIYAEKLRVEMCHSTSVFCVPDPYNILDENEVYLGFSNSWENPKTGLKEYALDEIDVLVARNPAHLASDIQKRKAVYKHELRNFKDVIIFPTKGKRPLASLLSGGDYDGDIMTVIWDPELVDKYKITPKPDEGDLPSLENCRLQDKSRKVSEFFKGSPKPNEAVDEFLVSSILFNARQTRLGFCTKEHEQLVYSGAKLSDDGPVLLATLAGYLVDANKQGLFQSEDDWHRVCNEARGGRLKLEVAYKKGKDHPKRRSDGQCVNILDYLKFDVTMEAIEQVHADMAKKFEDSSTYNKELTELFKKELERINDSKDPEREFVKRITDDLKERVDKVFEEWKKDARRPDSAPKRDFVTAKRNACWMIKQIVPLKIEGCDIYRDFIREEPIADILQGSKKATRWSLLRASAVYLAKRDRSLAWWWVGDELARIKARHMGPTRELTPAMHNILKANVRLIQRTSTTHEELSDEESDE